MNKFKKILLHKQALLLIPILIFFRNSADLFFSYIEKENDLVAHSGMISFIGNPSPESIKGRTKVEYLKIRISSEPAVTYELPNIDAPIFRRFFKSGEQITFYAKNPFPLAFSNRVATEIVKVVKDNKDVINHFKTYKKVSFNLMLFHLTLFLLFLVLYIYKTRKRLSSLD